MENTVDGLTKEKIEYNVCAFGADIRYWMRYFAKARKETTMLKYQKKINQAKHYLANNLDRLHRFNAGEYDPAT